MASFWISPSNLSYLRPVSSSPLYQRQRRFWKPSKCAPSRELVQQDDVGILCEQCNGKGWLLCDFCKGQKTNVKAENKRVYRRCPSCRAVGYLLCSNCKVFKCVTFPNSDDGDELSF